MPRVTRSQKPLIYVFNEGESEQSYVRFLKETFKDVAVIKFPKSTGLFEVASDKFKKDSVYRNNIEITDEIWFFFDIELKDIDKWDARQAIINKLRKLRKSPNIRIRLLMTSACVEYWLMLHYKHYSPSLITEADKKRTLNELLVKEPLYEKGNDDVISQIASKYPTACENAKKVFNQLLSDGLPCLEDTDDRNRWLATNSKTFSTVFEALDFLDSLSNNKTVE